MTPEEAKFILAALRPSQTDPSDPSLDPEAAEALRLRENDADLRAWHDRSRAFDAAAAERLREVRPPEGLEASLLAGLRLAAVPPRRRRLGMRTVLIAGASLAAAAAVALAALRLAPLSERPAQGIDPALAEARGLPGEPATLEDFRAEILAMLAELRSLGHVTDEPGEVAAWLAGQGAPLDGPVPRAAGEHVLAGCAVLEWRGHRVSLVCFGLPGEEGPPGLHLVSIAAEALRPFDPAQGAAEFAAADGDEPWKTAAWTAGATVQLAIAKGPRADLRRLVPLG